MVMTSQHMDESIYSRQSNPLIIQCLFAQRRKYSQAKFISGLYFLICVIGLCVFAVLKSVTQSDIVTGLSIGLSVAALLLSFLSTATTNKLKECAASIQQYIDVTLYSFPQFEKMNKKWFRPLSKNDIIEMVSKYPRKGFCANDKWYEDYSTKGACEQIYFSQLENIRWDRDLRRIYDIICKVIIIAIIIGVFVVALFINPTFMKMISIIPWCMPFIKYLISFWKGMKKDNERLEKLRTMANNVPDERKVSHAETWLEREIDLQNKIYEHRKNAILIPNFFYRLCYRWQQKNEESIARNHREEN